MKNLLLFNYTLLFGILIVAAMAVGGVFLAIRLNKKVSSNVSKVDWSKFSAKGQLKKHVPVLWPKELEFYYMFRSVLPKEFMIIPKLGIDEIVKPNGGNLLLFNEVKEEHVDFCVVKVTNMEPVAVLDTYYPSITDSTMQELPIAVRKALESVSIPVIKYEILDVPYNKDTVLRVFLDAVDPVTLAQLRKK